MTSNFFEHQRIAKTRSTYLLGLFALAVLGIIFAIYALIRLTLVHVQHGDAGGLETLVYEMSSGRIRFFQTELFTGVAGVVLLLILTGSLYKTWTLRHGGRTVAEDLGGKLILPSTQDLHEKRALHVVEEMAIAAGVPVPPVYVLEEEAINAFAAGKSPHDAVAGLTRGSLQLLSRDELQGVVAHEFSHILHGDMRLNTRILGLLHGILMISMLGYGLMRVFSTRRRSSSRDKDTLGIALVFFGFALYLIGSIGALFAKLIKASISRQREFLADASAVQYTRNPQGIANALKKIGGHIVAGFMKNAKSEEASHMFFSQGFRTWFQSAFATHPPLTDRIAKLDPHFSGELARLNIDEVQNNISSQLLHEASASFAGSSFEGSPSEHGASASSAALFNSIAEPTAAHAIASQTLRELLPLRILNAAADPYSARLLIFALVMEKDGEIRKAQGEYLQRRLPEADLFECIRLDALVRTLERRTYLPVVDLCVPSLQLMSEKQFREFRETLRQLVRADGACSIFEFLLHHVLLRHVGSRFHSPESREARFAPEHVKEAGISIIENLSRAISQDEQERSRLYSLGMKTCQLLASSPFQTTGIPDLDALNSSLTIMATAEPSMREYMMRACLAMIEHDGQVTAPEAELFRAIGDALDCPVPLVLRS